MRPFHCIFIVTALAACFFFGVPQGCSNRNLPPDPGTPWPDPHKGVFVSDADTLFFNGDGKSISWHFADEVPAIGKQGSGTYVFMFSKGEWRYDAAERLKILTQDLKEISFNLSLSERSTASAITLLRHDRPDSPPETFKKVL